jgi:hypothetical protein
MNSQTLMTEMISLMSSILSPNITYVSPFILSLQSKGPIDEFNNSSDNSDDILYHIIMLLITVDAENKSRDLPNTYRIDEDQLISLTNTLISLNKNKSIIEEDDQTDDEEKEFTCADCECDLDPNDLIDPYDPNYGTGCWQCAKCWDAAEKRAEDDIANETDDE